MSNFETPQVFTTRVDEVPISGPVLIELMKTVLAKGVPFRFSAKGHSMTPFIRDGDVITITPFDKKNPRLGDVVAFTRPETGNLVVHRIVAKRHDLVLIMGDSIQDNPDGIIPLENLLGRVTCIRRDRKRIWLGVGPEKILIAWLSRFNLLIPLRKWFASCCKHFSKRDK